MGLLRMYNKTGLQPVSKPVLQPLLCYKTVGERVPKSLQKVPRLHREVKKGEGKNEDMIAKDYRISNCRTHHLELFYLYFSTISLSNKKCHGNK